MSPQASPLNDAAFWRCENLGLHSPQLGERLVATAAQQIAERGLAAVSARSIASAACASPGSINYNFDGIERLFRRAFDLGKTLTERWILAHESHLLALPRSPDGAARALEHIIVHWTQAARPLALLYQEHLAATRSEPSAWTRLWRDFYLRIAAEFGLEEFEGRMMHLLFEAEALYNLSSWSPALEAAALHELIQHFGAFWLGGTPGPVIGAEALAEQTSCMPAEDMPPTAIRIMEAAAEVVKSGLDALTHRSVAAQAGVATGAVTHHFRSKEQLVAGAIQGLILSADLPMPPDQVRTAEDYIASLRNTGGSGGESVRQRRSLFLAAVRRPDLAASGAVIRFAHGQNTRAMMAQVFDLTPEALALHPGVLARLLLAIPLAIASDDAPVESHDRLVAAIERHLLAQLPVKSQVVREGSDPRV